MRSYYHATAPRAQAHAAALFPPLSPRSVYQDQVVTFLEPLTGAWGLLPFVAPATIFVAMRLGALVFPENTAHRAVGGSVLTLALAIGGVAVLGTVHLLTTATVTLSLAVITAALAYGVRGARLRAPLQARLQVDELKEVLPLLAVTCGALGAAILAARWLPIWAWDAIGYHLPYVNLVVMAHGLDGVPPAIPYISSYPHNVDLFTVALRLMLPDDRLVDLAQVPLGLLGAVATAAIARAHGAARSHAVAAGCAWLLVPAIFLQLPTDYVDVGSGAFLLCAVYFLIVPPSRRTLVVAGIALGLYLGSKPNGPMGTAVLGALLVVRGVQAKRVGATALAAGLVLAFGATSFVGNWLRYGNPTWPVELALGPWHFPGPKTMQQIIGSGAAMARTHGPLPLRMLTSWITFTSRPSFDMRIGGYGPLFVLALPFALVRLFGKPSPEASPRASWVALLATLASPEPAVARYVPAFPAFVLALAASSLVRLPLRARQVLLGLAAALGVYQVVYAWPGLTGEGPPLSEYAHMSDDERMRAVGSDGTPAPFIDARQRIGPGEVFAVNRLDDVPYYLAWGSRLENRVVWMPDELPTGSVEGYLEREKVRIFAAGNDGPVGRWAASHPDRAIPLFPCKSAPCTVYERR